MRVDKLMSRTVRSCSPHRSLADAAQLMWEFDCGCIPVVDEEHRVLGMITDRDICMAAHFKGKPLAELSIHDAMARQVLSCHPDDTVEAAGALMKRAQVRRLPVTDSSGRLVGVLSLSDIACEAERGHSLRTPEIGLGDVALTLSAVSQRHVNPRALHPDPRLSHDSQQRI